MEQGKAGRKIFPSEEMSGYIYCQNALCISTDALVLYAVSVEDDGAAAVATLHEGRNAAAPIIMPINALGTQGAWRWWPKGVELDNGLFVAFDAHVTSVTIFWRPRYEREA